MRTPSFRLWLAVLVASVALHGSDALAIDNGACCVQSTSRLESLINPNKGSDESFFTTAGGAPNVLLIVDTSGSMEDWPAPWPTTRGCNSSGASHPDLAGYDNTKVYQGIYTGFTSQTVPTEHSEWFNRSKYYTIPNSSFGNDFSNSASGKPVNTFTFGSAGSACNPLLPLISAADQAVCNSCLASDGYYVYDSGYKVASGNYLNYYGPRDFAAISALSHIIFSVREVRMSVMMLTDYNSGGKCFSGAGSGSCACLLQEFGPTCDKSFPLDNSAVQNNRNSLLNSLARQGQWSGCGTPLADLMYAGAHYFRSLPTPPANDGFINAGVASGYPTDSDFNEDTNSAGKMSVCSGCGFNAIVLITDGEPTGENLSIPSAMGTPTIGSPQCTGAYCGSKVDEIAKFLWNSDIRKDFNGQQNVATYTLGIALQPDATKLLQSTAQAGGGAYYPANRASEIETVFQTILDNIISRNNSFASAAVASVQTGSSSTPALLPRMLPKSGQPWQGQLWRFEQYNEFVEDADLNADGDKEDIFVVENTATPTAANIVTEKADGTFVKNNTAALAVPYWEANTQLVTNLGANVDTRNVWTIVDSDGDGAFTNADTLTRVRPGTAAEDLKLAEYMGIRGTNFCPSLAGPGLLLTKFGMTVATAAAQMGVSTPLLPADFDRLCARLVIRWTEGADLYDFDGDGAYNEARASVLGDIFHSSPVIVETPIDPFLCNLGLSNQCARTLFSQDLSVTPTPSPPQAVGASACGVTTVPPYEAWAFDSRRRDKLALVGSNDGMIHAFVSSRYDGTEACTGGQPVPGFNKGTGEEVWAFVPPDLLPKLPDLILNHEYMVDGDIMVRDIWADTSKNGQKEKNEFHTLAVVSEGRGGKHYIALEMLWNASGIAQDRPGFRWMFPQPCSEESATFGKTFFSLSPKAPPIGPVMIDNSGLPASSPMNGATPVSRNGVNTHERWVVALSGGWSPALEKGRGVYLVDAWEGQINGRRDNLWWKFEFDEGGSGANAPAKELTQSVSAPIALVDYGDNDNPAQDGFFDTAVFGDTSGQIWISRFFEAGRYDNTLKRISNWYTARSFEMDIEGLPGAGSDTTLPDGGVEVADPNAKSVANKAPFYYLPSVAIEPGVNKMRVFAGTGNRYALLEQGAGSCRFDNPLACSKNRCDEVKTVSTFKDAVVDIGKMETHWKSRRFEHGKLDKNVTQGPTATLTASMMCGSNGGTRVEAENEEAKVGTCDLTSGTDPNIGDVNKIKYACGLDATGASFTCTRQGTPARSLNDLLPDPTRVDVSGLGKNRFVGFWAYGGTQPDGGARVFDPTGARTPQRFDAARLSDRRSANTNSGDLIDVTSVGCAADQSCDGGAAASDYGWFLTYNNLEQKTATGGAVIASCVLWSDLSPSGGDGGVCGASITPLSRIYQADFITGQPNCAFGFLPPDGGAYARAQARTILAPPPEPATVVQVSKTGEVRYSAMIVEPGKGQATAINVSGGQDVLQYVYELPVSRSLHNCRHADGGCSTVP